MKKVPHPTRVLIRFAVAFFAHPVISENTFLKLETGVSFSQNANIVAPAPDWDQCPEGYQGKLKNGVIYGAGFGHEINDLLSFDFSYMRRNGYSYSKHQSSPLAGSIDPLPSKTRKFDLYTNSYILTARFSGRGVNWCNYQFSPRHSLAPFLGMGIGVTTHTITQFRSILDTPLTGHDVGSIQTSMVSKNSLTYQIALGLEYHYKKWGLVCGYRWFDAGKFKTPNTILSISSTPPLIGSLQGAAVVPWVGKMRAHEIFFEVSRKI